MSEAADNNDRPIAEISALDIELFTRASITVHLLGTTGLWQNRMPMKARQMLLMGSRRDTTTIKHDMYQEFREAAYMTPQGPTLLVMPAGAFKGALESVCADLPKITRASVARLISVPGYNVSIYGKPYLGARVVRQAGPSKAPDIRTRPFLPEWAAELTVTYTQPGFKYLTVARLIANAGITIGVGDYRQQLGAGDHGLYEIVDQHDPRYQAIVQNGGRDVQEAAMRAAEPLDDESRELLFYFDKASREWEIEKQREKKAPAKRRKKAEAEIMTIGDLDDAQSAASANGGDH